MTTPSDPGPQPPTDPYSPPSNGTPPPWGQQKPPRPRTNPWVWVAIGTLAALVVGSFVVPLLFFFGSGLLFGDFDDFDDEYAEDGYYYTDQGSVARAIEPACEELNDAAAAVRPFTPATEAKASLVRLAEATAAVATAIDGADPKKPAQLLSDDWSSLAVALDTYAKNVDDPEATFTLPDVDGNYVSQRIYEGNDACYVPTIVTVLDPEAAAETQDYFAGY